MTVVKGILDNIRVIDASTYLAGPMMGTLLAEFGADVIKIEQPVVGDPVRKVPPSHNNSSLIHKVTNRNKKCITLDFHKKKGVDLFYQLVAASDVVILNYRPQVLKKWSIDYEDLIKIKKEIVMMHFTAFGRNGPYSHKPGFARVGEAFSGLTHITGFPDRKPVFCGYAIADAMGGAYGAFSLMLALYHLKQTGQGQLVDLTLYEPMLRVMEDYIINYNITGTVRDRVGTFNPGIAPNDLYLCGDGRYVVLPASTQRMFERLAEAIDQSWLKDDPRFITNESRVAHRGDLDKYIDEFTGSRSLDEVILILEAHEVACEKINSVAEIYNDPHVKAREALIEVYDPELDRKVTMQGVFPKLSRTPGSVNWPGPPLGHHNREIYCGLLNLSEEEFKCFKEENVI